MFNLQPGGGLGFTGSKQIALGLGSAEEIPDIIAPTPSGGIGGGMGQFSRYGGHGKAYRESMLAQAREEDEMLVELLAAIVRLL